MKILGLNSLIGVSGSTPNWTVTNITKSKIVMKHTNGGNIEFALDVFTDMLDNNLFYVSRV